MVFSGLSFLFVFLPLVLAVYFVAPKKLRNAVLFLASLLFYAWGEPIYVVLMLFSTAVDYVHGLLVEKYRGTRRARVALISSIVINLLLLSVFKYSDFIVENINRLFGAALAQPNLPLPIGISFYTFQTMSYTIDVYRGQARAQRNIISFGAYVALFPQLIAGPIVRYQTIADQLETREIGFDRFADGAARFVTGLGKKVLLANNIGLLWESVSASPDSVLSAWLGIIAFSFQIYFDFSGYSDMAIGLGRMLGFTFLENFNYPYISKSITEFWRRWHISLGTWFREYVYIPLGGNRCGVLRNMLNIAAVWVLTGIWHGASWNFAAWGLYYCVLLIAEKLFLLKILKKLPSFAQHIYTLFCVVIGWVLFAFTDFSEVLRYLGYMFGKGVPLFSGGGVYALYTGAPLILLLAAASTPLGAWIKGKVHCATEAVAIVIVFLLSVAYIVAGSYNPFLYFRF